VGYGEIALWQRINVEIKIIGAWRKSGKRYHTVPRGGVIGAGDVMLIKCQVGQNLLKNVKGEMPNEQSKKSFEVGKYYFSRQVDRNGKPFIIIYRCSRIADYVYFDIVSPWIGDMHIDKFFQDHNLQEWNEMMDMLYGKPKG
jgi:hypothetical protein